MHLLFATHTLAPVSALSAQMPKMEREGHLIETSMKIRQRLLFFFITLKPRVE